VSGVKAEGHDSTCGSPFILARKNMDERLFDDEFLLASAISGSLNQLPAQLLHYDSFGCTAI